MIRVLKVSPVGANPSLPAWRRWAQANGYAVVDCEAWIELSPAKGA